MKRHAAVVMGVVLVVLGLLGLIYDGVTYTAKEELVKVGPLEATTKTTRTIPVPAWLSVLAVVGGAWLVVTSWRKP